MKKKALGIAAVAAAMTLSTGITAFAAGWVTETTPYGDKLKYVYDNGSFPSGNWFTDPDTQLVYHLDPDGYRMTETTVDGYWLDADGVRHEKTQEELESEARAAASKTARPTPNKAVAAAKVAATDAKEKNAASSTVRRSYISELKIIINKITKALADARTDTSVEILTVEDNVEAQRTFRSSNSVAFYEFTMWNSEKTNANSVDFTYIYDEAPEAERELYNTAYEQSAVAALGETEGKKLTDYIQSQREQGITDLSSEGTTDSGNTYTMKYHNNRVDISVTCTEVVPEEETAAETTENTEVQKTTPAGTTKRIKVKTSTTATE